VKLGGALGFSRRGIPNSARLATPPAASSSILAELVAQIAQFATDRLDSLGLLNPRIEDVDRKELVIREIDGRMAVDSTLDLFDDQMPANMKGRSILELLRLLQVKRHAVL
jgi:hypothetical protein